MLKEVDDHMVLNIKKNSVYVYMIIFFITPILSMIGNLYKNSLGLILLYIPNIIMLYNSLKLIVMNKEKLIQKKYILITIMFVLMILSCIFSSDKSEGFLGYNLEGLITHISYIGFFYCGLKMTNKDSNTKLIKILLIISTIICILCLTKIDIIYKMFNIRKEDYYFYVGPFHQFNHFGHYLLISNICSLYMLFNEKSKYFYFIIHSILLYTLIINDTFSVYLSYIIMLLLMLSYYIYKKHKLKKLIIVILTFILMSCLTFRDNFNVVYRNIQGIINDTNQIINSENKEDLYSIGTDRGKLWINAIKLIKEKPILGYGFENVKLEYSKLNVYTDKPHNLILEVSLSSGIPSMIIYLIIILSIIIKKIKTLANITTFELFSLLIVISYLIALMFGNTTFFVTPYFYIFLGILAQNYYKDKENEI